MRHFTALLLIAIALSSCASKVDPTPLRIGECAPLPCLAVTVENLNEATLSALESSARTRILGEISKILYASVEEFGGDDQEASYEALLKELEHKFNEEIVAGENRGVEWTLQRRATTLFENAAVVTIDVQNTGYLGGAHGFSERTIRSFLKADGSPIGLDQLVAPYSLSIFSSVIETEMRRSLNIPSGESLYDAGFSLTSGGTLPVPDNFGITKEGLLLHYNAYEIAPFSKGPTSLSIPLDTLSPVLRQGAEVALFGTPASTSHMPEPVVAAPKPTNNATGEVM